MNGRWHALAVGVLFLVLAGLIFLTSDPRVEISGAERLLRELLAPLESGLSAVTRSVTGLIESVSSFARIQEENRALRQEVAALKLQVRSLQSYADENENLRRIAGVKARLPEESLTARVIARSHNQWFGTVTIDLGRNDGLSTGLPVINADGVVGYVQNVTARTAQVTLLTDPRSAVGGMIARNEVPILVEGAGDPLGKEATVRALVGGAVMQVGDRIVTSGLSQVFPKGIPIGVITHVEYDSTGLRQHGVLTLDVDFQRLDWVTVLLGPSDIDVTEAFAGDSASEERPASVAGLGERSGGSLGERDR